jgi:YD repeat-containing protein
MEVIVIKKMCSAVFVVVVLQCVLSLPLHAQLPPSCTVTQSWYFPDPLPFGWYVFQAYPGTYAYLIAANTCPPSAPCHCNTAGQPIALATGETFIDQVDIRIPGLGGGLSLTRTWDSYWSPSLAAFQGGSFGPNWRSTYEERIVFATDNYIKYIRSDATSWTFGADGPATAWAVISPANIGGILSTDTSTNSYFTLTSSALNGEQRRFDKSTGKLIAIIDRNGNTTTLAYDSSERLSTVTDAASRTMTFTYGGSFTDLVTSVSTSAGISLSYAYDAQGRLIQVTKPDLTTVTYTYNSLSQITAVTDSNGKVLESHTYDSVNRGLTASKANGVEAVTITYP